MPIAGLTDKKATFPRIGILRKGGPKKNTGKKDRRGNPIMGYGDDLDHFRFDTKDSGAESAFNFAYCQDGLKPRAINIILPYGTVDENFYTGMRAYSAGALQIECDRESILGIRNKLGIWQKCLGQNKPQCKFPECLGKDSKDRPISCKETGMLNVIIPELKRFAFVTVLTHSKWDISRLTQQLTAIQITFGRLNGIPLILSRKLESISTPSGEGKRARRDKWLLDIEVSPAWASKQLNAAKQTALQQAEVFQMDGQSLLMPEPDMAPVHQVEAELLPAEDPPLSEFTKTELWQDIGMYFHNAKTSEQAQRVYDRAIACVEEGKLPTRAKRHIADLLDTTEERIRERFRL